MNENSILTESCAICVNNMCTLMEALDAGNPELKKDMIRETLQTNLKNLHF